MEGKSSEYSALERRIVYDIIHFDWSEQLGEKGKFSQATSLLTRSTITVNPADYEMVGEYRDHLLYELK